MAWSRDSRQSRGYGAAWDRVRKVVMARDFGVCQVCLRAGRLGVIAYAVDHITSKAKCSAQRWSQARTDHPDNLQAICRPCHDVKSQAELGKTLRPKVKIGLDGWPLEG